MKHALQELTDAQHNAVVDLLAVVMCVFLATGWVAHDISHGSTGDQLAKMTSEEQLALLGKTLSSYTRRALAEDYCAQTKATQRICANARRYAK